MKKLSIIFALAALTAPVYAAQELASVEIVNLAAFKAAAYGAYVHLQGITKPGDGNDAYYTQSGFVCTPDDFNIIKDAAGHCYTRGLTGAAPVPLYASIVAVQAIGAAASGIPEIQTASYIAGNSKGGARYSWNATSTVNDCAHVQATGVATGRYVLRTDLQAGVILPTQCGAWFDADPINNTGHDDAAAWNATEVAAANNGYVIGPVNGVTKFLSTVTPGVGVIHRGAGQGLEIINCRFTAAGFCFYIQNANGTNSVEAPKFFDFTINGSGGNSYIQYNSIAGGFSDDNTTQAYMFHPIVERVSINNGLLGIQCNKCFDGHFSNNFLSGLDTAIDFEGSDFMVAASNQIANFGNRALIAISRGTFSNFDVWEHNDIGSSTLTSIDAPLYSTARSITIRNNSMEDDIVGHAATCEIHLADGLTDWVYDNLLSDIFGGVNSICVEGTTWYNLDLHANNVASGAVPNARFNSGTGLNVYINAAAKTQLAHYNNRTETTFPMNLVPLAPQVGGKTLYFATPNTATNIAATNYGFTGNPATSVFANNDNRGVPAFILPATGTPNSLLNFVVDQDLSGVAMDVCLVGSAVGGAGVLTVILKDAGVAAITTTASFSATGPGMTCPAALQNVSTVGAASFDIYNSGTKSVALESLAATKH